jgi:RNA polymerase sigma factor for flagellar operon FliA
MISMQGVPSALVARNESWVRKQAQAMMRHVPANVEKADLIQVGLIAVAQAALGFVWEGDHDSDEAREAFLRYARMRVKGAMIDEMRQMDVITREQRRKIKVIQIARERWRVAHGIEPGLAQLASVCKMDVDEISLLDQLAHASRSQSMSSDDEDHESLDHKLPATEKDEVEARVDTAIVLRRLEEFFAKLPARERDVIDAYLGVGLSPVELAASLQVTPSRVSQIFTGLLQRLAVHFGTGPDHRATDRPAPGAAVDMDQLVSQRERALHDAAGAAGGSWAELLQDVLVPQAARFGDSGGRMDVTSGTRWG